MKYFPLLSVFIFPSYCFAENSLVEELVVTPTFHEQPLAVVNGSTAVVDQAEIFIVQPAEIPEILEYQSGAQIVRSGGRASQTSLYTRGTNSDHTLVLIDGMRFGSVSTGQAQLQLIDPEQIQRLEYVKGPHSALYGSDAIGGVLQIFTLSRTDERQAYLNAQVGSQSTRKMSGGISDSFKRMYYSAAISGEASDGIDNLVDDTGFSADRDAYEKMSANVGAGIQINRNTELNLRHFENKAQVDFDSLRSGESDQPYSNDHQRTTSVMLKAAPAGAYSTKLTLGHANEESESLNRQDPSDRSAFNSQRSSIFWLNSFNVNQVMTWDAGLEYSNESVDSTTEYLDSDGDIKTSRNTASAFTQVSIAHENLSAQAGLRNDNSSDFGSHRSGNVSFGLSINEEIRMYASWGEGFKSPSFNDLYWPSAGNENLLPETSQSFEIGLKSTQKYTFYTVSVFKTDIDNLIDWAPDVEGRWAPININSAEIHGAEVDMNVRFNDLSIASTLSYTEALDAESGEMLDNRAKTKFTLNLSHDFGPSTAGVLFKAVSKRKASSGDFLPGYGTVGLFASMELSERYTLRIKVHNLFDREYQVNERFNEGGFNANVKVSYKFWKRT